MFLLNNAKIKIMENVSKDMAVGYARVSSREQEETGYSLPAQEKLMTEYCSRKTLKIEKLFSVAESASGAKQRKVFTEMMGYLEKKKIKILLCEKVDRITRNFKEALVINDWLEQDPERQIHFVKQNLIIHQYAKSDEKFRWDIEIVLAKKYISNLSEEVKKGQKEKIAQGWFPTTPPLGYKTIGEKGKKIHVIDETVAPYIREMFSLYATGNYSTVALGEKMHKLGFRSRARFQVAKSKIHKLLSEPFYYGKFVWNGHLYQGKHEPLITKDLFDQVNAKMTKGTSPYHNNKITELRGKIFCGSCKKTITWENQKGHSYGGCKQCKSQIGKDKKYIRQETLENELLTHITVIAPQNERVLAVLSQALKESHSKEIEFHDTQVNNINNSLARIQQSIRTMYNDRLDERITASEYDDKLKEFTLDKDQLLNSLEKLKADNTEYYQVGFLIHEIALRARKIYLCEKATVEERRMLLSYAFSNISVLRGEIKAEYTKSFAFLAEWMPKLNTTLEPEKVYIKYSQKEPFGPFQPILLRDQGSNLGHPR